MTPSLPGRPSLEHLRKQAKDILQAHKAGKASACAVLRRLHRFADAGDEEILAADFSLNDVQFALAMDYGFKSWAELKSRVRSLSDAIPERKDYSAVSLRGNGHSDDSFSLTFTAAANLLGQDAQYDRVFPLSTNPFAPAFYLPEGCPSFWHQRGRAQGLDILSGRFGIRCEELQLPETRIDPVGDPERFRSEHLTKCAAILRDALKRGCLVLVENAWAAPEGGGFVSWLWFGLAEEARGDGMILGMTLNGRHDNYIVDLGRCWALSAGKVTLNETLARRMALDRAIHRIRADGPPFETSARMAYGLAAIDAWMERMHHVPFCKPCVESAPDPDRARGWSCARDCATSVGEGAAAASAALRKWAVELATGDGKHLQEAGERYGNIERLLRPFTTWEKGRAYHAMMGNLQEQKQHAKDVLQPIREELEAAADGIEAALISTS